MKFRSSRFLAWAYRRLGPRYPRVALFVIVEASYVVVFGGLLLLRLYQPMSDEHFWLIVLASELLVFFDNIWALGALYRELGPADEWLRGRRDEASTVAAWKSLASLPRAAVLGRGTWLLIFDLLPVPIFGVWLLGLPWYTTFAFIAGASVTLLYGIVLRFFAIENTLRPVLRDVAKEIPDGANLGDPSIPLQSKLLAGLPAINIISGVVVAGLASGGQAHLSDLGTAVVAAVVVAFSISLGLTVLLSRSILEPVRDLEDATQRVAGGDFSTRVPVVSTDETGGLAGSFNAMVAGLEEREALREAFGAYVDPDLADRVLEEGADLRGDEVEVTVVFVDIRDFTAFAERSSAAEVVTELNRFYDLVVPVLTKHRGHANKFVGDGLLGVFGAPERLADHADRAVTAALEIAEVVRREYEGRLRIGIGINSGPVVAGAVGGGGRLDFTVIGDPVNTASRVEAVTRDTDDEILLTEATRCLLQGDYGEFEERGTVELKGKTERVRLWAPCAEPASADGDDLRHLDRVQRAEEAVRPGLDQLQ